MLYFDYLRKEMRAMGSAGDYGHWTYISHPLAVTAAREQLRRQDCWLDSPPLSCAVAMLAERKMPAAMVMKEESMTSEKQREKSEGKKRDESSLRRLPFY
jgi:hypothetical protein